MARMDWLLLGVSVALVLACGVFGSAEYSFVAVDRAQVEKAAGEGDRRAAGVREAVKHLSTQLSGAQVGITLTNLALGFLAEPSISRLLHDPLRAVGIPDGAVEGISVALGMAIATVVTMLFGELVPKKIAIAVPMRTALFTQRFMRAFTRVMLLPIRALNGSANAVVRLLGVEPQEVWASTYLVAVMADEACVRGLKPDILALEQVASAATLGRGNVGVAALAEPGRGYDVVDRFFAPGSGVPEDPTTGSLHTILAPLFAAKLGRTRVAFHQAYPGRGGDLVCEDRGERVAIAGAAVTVIESRLRL